VLDQGRIIERGTHASLLAASGAYALMWERQQVRVDQDGVPVVTGSPVTAQA
jgi:ABC-type transport system involved in cytochrome bd biosynthesis fused ATPase/permease subunit